MEERAVERIVETYLLSDLEQANKALVQGKEAKFKLPGKTPGEKLSYVTAAIWIVEKIKRDRCDFREAYSAYQLVIKGK